MKCDRVAAGPTGGSLQVLCEKMKKEHPARDYPNGFLSLGIYIIEGSRTRSTP